MRPLVLIFALVAICGARPEPPTGYNYPSPGSTSVSSNGHSGAGSLSGGFISGGFASSGIDAGSGFTSGAGFASGGLTQVHKHVYVHAAPEDQEVSHPRVHFPVGNKQKHYKIIFIKAPSPSKYLAPILPVQPQNEEKTLVYVLSKKPEEQQDIIIPTAAPTQPSKPEVYFIKYKTNKEITSTNGELTETDIRGNFNSGVSLVGGTSHGGSLSSGVLSTRYGVPGATGYTK